MLPLELLAPAKDKAVGIAAIDCGADAVYIAGPSFGNRKAAGNSLEDIRELCSYAHRFGARIFLTVNTYIYNNEWDTVHSLMLAAQEAGVDAFIIREERLLTFADIVRPMHASTQCAIRDAERAKHFEALGCSRIILERGLSMEQVREICAAVRCEVEFFVHGALCVCYSGDCRLSEFLDGRSADRGDCIQACRSLYDLVDAGGKVLAKDKALLSLRDFKLLDRLGELAAAGVCSFKIEGRLKNASYVKNVVREYSLALDDLVARNPGLYRRASYGSVSGGFVPDSDKTFNRGYTQWWLDGKKDKWSSMDAPKAMGEYIGEAAVVRTTRDGSLVVSLRPAKPGLKLANGDGFAFTAGSAIRGFRGDRCEGLDIFCKKVEGLKPGTRLYRNINAAFERELEALSPRRELAVALDVRIDDEIEIRAESEDGRVVEARFPAGAEKAENRARAEAMLREQLSKRSGIYRFALRSLQAEALPHLAAAAINALRREIAERLDAVPVALDRPARIVPDDALLQPQPANTSELMRTRYCIKYELGLCPRYQGAAPTGQLWLVNNGRRLPLGFDCGRCEMTVGKPKD